MLTKCNDKTMKRGLAAMGALSVLLGAQLGVLATAGSGGTGSNPPGYDQGWTDGGLAAQTYIVGTALYWAFVAGRCSGQFSSASSYGNCMAGARDYTANHQPVLSNK